MGWGTTEKKGRRKVRVPTPRGSDPFAEGMFLIDEQLSRDKKRGRNQPEKRRERKKRGVRRAFR